MRRQGSASAWPARAGAGVAANRSSCSRGFGYSSAEIVGRVDVPRQTAHQRRAAVGVGSVGVAKWPRPRWSWSSPAL